MKLLFIAALLFLSCVASGQLQLTNPFSPVKRQSDLSFATARDIAAIPGVLNTFKVNVSLPGYWYSGSKQQSAVVGLGYAFEHYVNDSLLYSVGPYVWYNSPVPTGTTKLPIGYGAAGTYKGVFLLGVLTPDFIHWGPVLTLNFSFGNGGIAFNL